MSKRIRTRSRNNGTLVTSTVGKPEGRLPNFDVTITTPPTNFKKATEMKIDFGNGVVVNLTGRQFRTLEKICRQHANAVG